MPKRIEYELSVNLATYQRGMRTALAAAVQLDRQFAKLVKSVVELESSSVNIQVNADGVQQAKSAINSIDDIQPEVMVDVNDAQVQDAKANVAEIDDIDPTVQVDVDDSETDAAKANVAEIDDLKPEVSVDVDTSSIEAAQAEVRSGFSNIQLTFDVGQIAGLVGSLQGLPGGLPIVGTLIDAGEASRQFESGLAATGKELGAFAGYGDVFKGVIASGLADSQQGLVDIALRAVDAGTSIEDLQSVITTTLGVARVTGVSADEAFNVLNKTVKTGLAGSFTEAGDLVVSTGSKLDGFTEGVDEFGAKMAAGGITGAQAFKVFASALDVGVQNTGRLGEVFNNFPNLISEAANAIDTGGTTPFLDALTRVGFEASPELLATATEDTLGFFGELSAAIDAQLASGAITPVDADALTLALFGDAAGEIGAQVFRDIDFAGALEAEVSSGNLEAALAPLQDTITGSLGRLKNIIAQDLGEAFTLAGKPLSDLLDNIPDKLNAISDLIESGVGIPEALEIVLEAPGLANDIRQLQATIGGFVVDLSLAIAGFLEGIGKGDAASTLRTSAASSAQSQLGFDLAFLDPETAGSSIALALQRGVSAEGTQAAVEAAIVSMLDEGMIEGAKSLVSQLEGTAFLPTTITGYSWLTDLLQTSQSRLIPTTPGTAAADAQTIQDSVPWFTPFGSQKAIVGAPITFDTSTLATDVNDAFLATPIAQASVQANIEPALRGAWGDAIRNVMSDPDPALAQASADELVTLFNTSLLNTGVEPVTFEDLVGMNDLGLLQSGLDEATGLFVSASGEVSGQVNLTNDTITTSYRQMTGNVNSTLGTIPTTMNGVVDQQIAALARLNFAVTFTQNLLAGAGIDPAALAAYIFTQQNQGGSGGTGATARAGGGDVGGGGLYKVGEQGWEYFIPGMDGAIIPHDLSMALAALGGGGGGGGSSSINNTMNFSSTVNAPSYAASMGAAAQVANRARGFF